MGERLVVQAPLRHVVKLMVIVVVSRLGSFSSENAGTQSISNIGA